MQTAFHEPHLRDIPRIEFEPSGLKGFVKLISQLRCKELFIFTFLHFCVDKFAFHRGQGAAFFEEVTNTINLGFYSFFAPFNRLIFGKQVFPLFKLEIGLIATRSDEALCNIMFL